jgi:hypothetical protein
MSPWVSAVLNEDQIDDSSSGGFLAVKVRRRQLINRETLHDDRVLAAS